MLLSVFASVAVVGGATFVVHSWRASQERSRNAVQAYLDSLAHRDYNAAHALVCTDETGVDRGPFEQAERRNPIRSYENLSFGGLSSWTDVRVRHYRVWVTRANGDPIHEVIPTQDGDSVCIQYASIERYGLI